MTEAVHEERAVAVERHGNLRPPFERGNSVATKHGAYSVLKLAPRAEEISDEIRALVPARSEADEPAVRLLSLTLAQIEAAAAWVAERGIVDAKGNPQPVLKVMVAMTNTAARLADRLGMTPAGRAQLGLDLAKGEAFRLTITRLANLAENEQ